MIPINIEESVPEIYVSESRDFQLLCRLYNCIVNGVKFNIDSILGVIDTDTCNSKLLELLQSKLGFFSDKTFYSDDLRYILKAFPYIIKNKGSKKAIEQTLALYLKINHVNTEVRIDIVNNSIDDESYTINIGIESTLKDLTVLNEVLKYVIPSGYKIKYYFYTGVPMNELCITNRSNINAVQISDLVNSHLGDTTYSGTNSDIENRLINDVGTMRLITDDSNLDIETISVKSDND